MPDNGNVRGMFLFYVFNLPGYKNLSQYYSASVGHENFLNYERQINNQKTNN